MARDYLKGLDLGPETCAIYVRLSQDRGSTNEGVERQETECREYAASKGLEVSQVYSDNDTSATSGKDRPGFDALLADEPEAVVVWHQDRLLRLTSDLERVIALDIPVYTVAGGDLDLATPAGRAVARTVAAWSTYETEQKAKRQQSSNRQRAEKGHWQFSRRPYGYERRSGRIEVVPEEAEIVREGFRRYIAGESYYGIAADWNARGVPTLGTGSPAWSMARVRQILRNPRYAGLSTYNGEPVEFEEGVQPQWTPLIDRDTWDDYLAKREGRKRSGSWSSATKHLMSGLAECGVCGSRMLARPDRHRIVYACKTGWCVSRGAEDVDALVTATVLARLDDPAILAALRKAPDVTPLVEEIARLRRNRDIIKELVGDGLLTKREARRKLTALGERIDALTRRRDAMRRKSPLADLAAARKAIPRKWEAMPVLAKRRVIADLGLRVVVDKTYRRGPVAFDPRTVRLLWEDADAPVE